MTVLYFKHKGFEFLAYGDSFNMAKHVLKASWKEHCTLTKADFTVLNSSTIIQIPDPVMLIEFRPEKAGGIQACITTPNGGGMFWAPYHVDYDTMKSIMQPDYPINPNLNTTYRRKDGGDWVLHYILPDGYLAGIDPPKDDTKIMSEEEAEGIFNKEAKKNMRKWSLTDFKKTHKRLYKSIIESIQKAHQQK